MARKAQIIVFLTVVAGVLGLLDFVCYKGLELAFGALPAVAWAIVLLTLGFIGASIIGMKLYGAATRVLYWITAVWMGFAAYLFMGSVAYIAVSALAGGRLPIVEWAVLALSALAAAYGVVRGRKLTVAEREVALAGLPESWQGKKAVWASDLHLGQVYGAKRAERIVAAVNALEPDIVFIGGDLYDGASITAIVDLASPLAGLKAPQGVYFVTGNHEEFGSEAPFTQKVRSLGIRILDNEKVDLDGLQVVGVDYRATEGGEAFRETLARIGVDRGAPSILLKHEPRHLDIAADAGISLQISGHVHRAQQWPFEYVAKLVYKGYSYGLKRFGPMQVYVSSGAGTWGPPLRVGSSSEIALFRLIKG